MQPLRVLCYADMDALVPHCVAAAEMLRAELGAHIIMMVVSTDFNFHEAFANYELYDHRSLDQLSNRFVPVDAMQAAADGKMAAATFATRNSNDVQSADAPGGNGARAEPIVAADHRRIELFGLRKELARSKTLRKIYRVFRNPALLPLYAKSWIRRIPRYELAVQPIRAWHRASRVRAFLRALRPDVIILAEDNVERVSHTLVNEGRRQAIPTIIIPFTIPNPLEPAKSYRHLSSHRVTSLLARLVSVIFPKWCYLLGDQKLLRMPAFTALVMEALGQSSPAPWILNRGDAARIALDSEAQRDRYLRLGFPSSQLAVVGDINSDVLCRGLANKPELLPELLARHGLPAGRPLIVCGFPPDQFAGELDDVEFRSYDELIAAWIASFAALGDRANVLVRPHPRTPIDRFKAFALPNLRYTAEPTAELIPLCDLYVASISATIRWAIACGIPAINYDTYRYRYGDYDGADGVIHTESLADFRAQLTRFVDDPSFASCMRKRQQNAMHRWGIVDDALPRRFAALVTELKGADPNQSGSGRLLD